MIAVDWRGLFVPTGSLVELVIRGTVSRCYLESDGRLSVIRVTGEPPSQKRDRSF